MLPNLIIIGAMKAATSSLHYYLGCHPEISMSRVKELNFFVAERRWGRGVAWYESQFAPGKVRGEASPLYTMHPRFSGVPERMAEVVPEARLIYVVRHPVARAVSQYIHEWTAGVERQPLADVLARPDGHYVQASCYHAQLERYLRWFAREQILLLTAEDLERDRRGTLGRVFRFLGVDDAYWSVRFRLKRHRTALKRHPTDLARRLEPRLAALSRALPWGARGYLEWLLLRPLSRKVVPPAVPPATWRAAGRAVAPDTAALAAAWGVGADWLPGLLDDGHDRARPSRPA